MDGSFFSQVDAKKAEALLHNNLEAQLLFSEGTYQVEFFDQQENAEFWPFLQMDDSGKLLDSFCTCKEAEDKRGCVHLFAAYQKIFRGFVEPLHVRFRESLWNLLCQMASRRHGYKTEALLGDLEQGFTAHSHTGKLLFFLKPLSSVAGEHLKEIILNGEEETEETSLKFSNLSQEELKLWKEGRPTSQLQYELSFWSDLAKWWMLLQERGASYHLHFTEDGLSLPRMVKIVFEGLIEAHIYIAQANWPTLIPSLSTVNTPLPIYELPHQVIKQITYDEKKKAFLLETDPLFESAQYETKRGIEVGEWSYLPHLGFYPLRIDPLLKEREIPQEKIASFLQKHPKILQKYLQGDQLFRHSVQPSYHLSITESQDLLIETYLFEPKDLQKPHSAYFGAWCYLEGKGFYLLEGLLFQEIVKRIPRAQVSDFVTRHRHWLNQYEGFQTHLSSLESHMSYRVDEQGALLFETHLEELEKLSDLVDYEEWIYLRAQGFYAKMSNRAAPLMKPGLVVESSDVSSFIRANREDLEHIKGFFTTLSPLEKTGLRVFLNKEKRIVVEPYYQFKTKEFEKRTTLYGEYAYIIDEGFFELPDTMKLPINYQKRKVIAKSAEPYFLSYELELLRPLLSDVEPCLLRPSFCHLKVVKMRKDKKGKQGSWLLTLDYETEMAIVSAYEVWSALQSDQAMLFSPAGLLMLHDPRFTWLKSIGKKRWSKSGTQLRLTTLEWLKLNVLDQVEPPIEKKSLSVLEELTSFQATHPLDLEGLKSQLRSYQQQGVRWLWFLYCQGLSGLLCDEMGLGKTHQAMALIAAAKNRAGSEGIKILVVCPTSVIYHWEDLLKRFFPKVRVLVFYALARNLKQEYDLLLTSYGTLRSEKKELSQIPFEIAIYDEVQIAKNSHSQTHRALRKIDAKMRLGLTGTPIENRLLELKALFDLILPGYLPNEALFKKNFANPIEKHHDKEKAELLQRFIKPFILRRKKTEVLLELPEKIEEISYCYLTDEQKKLYNATVKESRDPLLQELQNSDKPIPFIHLFALLTKLKQICNHPTLITKKYKEYKKHPSGKWELFVELLSEIRESGQKVVVFSQYLEMLDLIETYLREEKIGYATIRGSTKDRRAQVEKFTQDPECEVFVASLQAAGVGIDLIAASVVIHYDRWWNPAKENQATDRVHRMGQKRGVQVFKLVTKETIEEHIHQLIEKKSALSSLIAYDDQDQIKTFGRNELIEILSSMKEYQ